MAAMAMQTTKYILVMSIMRSLRLPSVHRTFQILEIMVITMFMALTVCSD